MLGTRTRDGFAMSGSTRRRTPPPPVAHAAPPDRADDFGGMLVDGTVSLSVAVCPGGVAPAYILRARACARLAARIYVCVCCARRTQTTFWALPVYRIAFALVALAAGIVVLRLQTDKETVRRGVRASTQTRVGVPVRVGWMPAWARRPSRSL
jgi:hypothetical protein